MGFNHVQLNAAGYPIRPGQQPCSFYLRNGSCKFTSTCKFDHSRGPSSSGRPMGGGHGVPATGYPVSAAPSSGGPGRALSSNTADYGSTVDPERSLATSSYAPPPPAGDPPLETAKYGGYPGYTPGPGAPMHASASLDMFLEQTEAKKAQLQAAAAATVMGAPASYGAPPPGPGAGPPPLARAPMY